MAEVKTVDRLFTGWRGIALATFAALQVLACVLFLPGHAQSFGLFGLENSSTRGFYTDPVPERPGWVRVAQLTVGDNPLQVGDLIKFDNS